jgi:hypothetical protein
MNLQAFELVAQALGKADARWLVVGGMAVNAHGYPRFTADLDLVIALDPANIHAAFRALADIGYRPNVPVTADQFADAVQRQRWIADKGMQVLNFFSPVHKAMTVDIFVYEPFDFAAEYGLAPRGELLPGLWVRYVTLPTLIRMKQAAGRPRDLDDIEHLKRLAAQQPTPPEDERHG